MDSPSGLCEERHCWLRAEEWRSFATKRARSTLDFGLCAEHDRQIDRGATFEIVSELRDEGWVQYIVISPH